MRIVLILSFLLFAFPAWGMEDVAKKETIDVYAVVPGTLRAVEDSTIFSMIDAVVQEVLVRPGDVVDKGDLLVLLDGILPGLQLEEARRNLDATRANLVLSRQDYLRTENFFQNDAATKKDLETAHAALEQSRALFGQAETKVELARIRHGYARIRAHEKGRIISTFVDAGELAWTGRPLLKIQSSGPLRLEAGVGEKLVSHVRENQQLTVVIPSRGIELQGRVDEIVPEAHPISRTFVVKVVLDTKDELFDGMFGRLLVPAGTRKVVTVPLKSVRTVGQLSMVDIRTGSGVMRVYVRTGCVVGTRIEILSGLDGGEIIVVPGKDIDDG